MRTDADQRPLRCGRLAHQIGVPGTKGCGLTLLLLAPVLCGCDTAVTSSPTLGAELYRDFRGKEIDTTVFRYLGKDAAVRIKPEASGLRVAIPAEMLES